MQDEICTHIINIDTQNDKIVTNTNFIYTRRNIYCILFILLTISLFLYHKILHCLF